MRAGFLWQCKVQLSLLGRGLVDVALIGLRLEEIDRQTVIPGEAVEIVFFFFPNCCFVSIALTTKKTDM